MRALVLIVWLLCPALALAQSDPAERARAASDMLETASARLAKAEGSRDRVRALTEIISAYETGLGALRSGLRQAALREEQLSARLQARDAETSALLAALMRTGGTETPVLLLHPGGPTGTARAGMLIAEVAPALNAKAEDLRRDLEELRNLQALQSDAAERLQAALGEVQTARTALNQAIADRTDLPKRFVADPVREAILLTSVETLDGFARDLDQISSAAIPQAPATLSGAKGSLGLPVQGRILRAAGEPDAAGITRPGILVATQPQALVTSPTAATLRYAGPLLDFGQVMILEPKADVLFVFAGLETIYGETGDMIDAGAPLGLMGGSGDKIASELSTDGDDTGVDRSETLYIEVREKNRPVNPTLWFRTEKDG
jgi:septal ring factor EnvC (AmiA/AmiB activator)